MTTKGTTCLPCRSSRRSLSPPTSPRRDDLADELGAFANASGGIILCGVADGGTIQHLSRNQLAALDRLLVEVCTDVIEPPLRIAVRHRELDGKASLLVNAPPKM